MIDLGPTNLTIHDVTHLLRTWAAQPDLAKYAKDPKTIYCSELYRCKNEIHCTIVGLKNAENPLGQKLANYLSLFGKLVIKVQ